MSLRFVDVEVDGVRCDVTVDGARIRSVDPTGGRGGADRVVDGGGGALIPGLWDHHIHLTAAGAATTSVSLDGATTRTEVADALRRGAARLDAGTWLRAVGYHESMAGDVDRHDLDRIVEDRPVRVQHRSGARWILNSAACRATGLDDADHPGVEHAADGSATGRVTGADDWLRARLPAVHDVPDTLRPLGEGLVAAGVVGVTDTGPDADTARWELLADAAAQRRFAPRIVVTGGPELVALAPPPPLVAGPAKLYLADHSLPGLDTIVEWVERAHRHGRPVALHCVTRVSLAMALAAFDEVGARAGDRIEHGSVIAPDAFDALRRHRLTVVTQPGFVAERGDTYLTDVDVDDREHLYRCASLLAAGIPVAGSTDAPYSSADPWAAVAAAVERTTPSGRVLGADERVDAAAALGMFLGRPDDPGGPARRVEAGAAADVCLLDGPLRDVLATPSADHVRFTVIGGEVVYET